MSADPVLIFSNEKKRRNFLKMILLSNSIEPFEMHTKCFSEEPPPPHLIKVEFYYISFHLIFITSKKNVHRKARHEKSQREKSM